MKLFRTAALVGAAVVAAAFGAILLADDAESAEATPAGITVSGTGSTTGVPDQAEFSFGTITHAATASDALAANNREATRLIAAIKAGGVADRDVRTADFSLSPRYAENGQRIVGYAASNTVFVTVRDVDAAGRLVDAVIDAGANNVQGPALSRSDRKGLEREALRNAVADARAKAEALAAASGVSLGAVRRVVEAREPVYDVGVRAAAAQDGVAMPIEQGRDRVEARVAVTFSVS